jgi:hypothetical protein
MTSDLVPCVEHCANDSFLGHYNGYVKEVMPASLEQLSSVTTLLIQSTSTAARRTLITLLLLGILQIRSCLGDI